MLRGRVSEDTYVFTSELYAQVTAGAIATSAGAVLIDTLPFPVESRELAAFVARTCRPGVRYVILTHYHADHTYGAYLFPQADVVAHARCQALLTQVGIPALEEAKVEEAKVKEAKVEEAKVEEAKVEEVKVEESKLKVEGAKEKEEE